MPIKSTSDVPFPNVDVPSFLFDAVPDSAASCQDPNFTQPFLFSAERSNSKHLSLIQFKHLVKCFAAGLQEQSLQAGDHVLLVSPNYIHSMVVALGTIAAGGVFCTAQPDLKVREYVDQMVRDEPRFLFVCNEQPLKEQVVTAWKLTNGDDEKYWLFDECTSTEERASEQLYAPHHERFWTEVLDYDSGPNFQWKRLTTEEDCSIPCMLFTTSGTSGLRKAAMFSHRNLVASWTAVGHRIRQDFIKCAKVGKIKPPGNTPRRVLHTVSISRALGTTLPLAVSKSRPLAQVEVYFMSKTYADMRPYLECIQTLGITEVSCAPFTLVRLFVLAKSEELLQERRFDFSKLRSITSVGAPASQSTLNGVRDYLLANRAPADIRVERALGITEAGSLVSSWHLADEPSFSESCQGKVEPNIQVKIIVSEHEHDEGIAQEAVDDQCGEIWLRGPSVISGYYKNEAATRDAFTDDGWFKTGDIGYFQDDKLFLLDRKKDILKTPDNIPPAYIEGVLLEHPDVADVGVVGIYDPAQELQRVRAYIVKRPNTNPLEEDICSWMERESADTAHLTAGVEFLEQLPRNTSGKLLRRELRERARKSSAKSDLTALTLSSQVRGGGLPAAPVSWTQL